MKDSERVLQSGDDSSFRRLGVDVNDKKFRKVYFRYRDMLSEFVGNGNLPTATIMQIAYSFRYPEEEKEVVAKKKRGRPKKVPVLA